MDWSATSPSSSDTRRTRLALSMASVMYTNAVYFPSSSIYQGMTPGMMNYGCVNHVYYAFAGIVPDGSVFLSDEWADARAPVDGFSGGLGSLLHLKQQHPHLRVLLSVGGGDASSVFPNVAADVALRTNFARSVLGLVEASGLDGIDIVWEYPNDVQQGQDFVALLAAVRTLLPKDHFILTAALPAQKGMLEKIDLGAMADSVDFVNLKTYDFFGPWTSRTGHHAQLYAMSRDEPSASVSTGYVISRGFPSKKILLGIPAFGRSFLGATGPGQEFRGRPEEDITIEYKHLPSSGCREIVDHRHVAAQSVGGDEGFVSYDNPETVKAKAGFCQEKGLGGLFYWHGPGDSQDKSRSLVVAGFRALHSS